MKRFLGVDLGHKRIGLAIGDDETRLAVPLTTIAVQSAAGLSIRAIIDYAREYGADAFVLGLPLNMDDSEGPQAMASRMFGKELEKASGMAVFYYDERLSSHAAEDALRPAELTRKKKRARLDRVAAAILLQDFLDKRSGG